MKLYHFCSGQNLDSIEKEGLTLGLTPILNDGKIRIIKNTQWLTRDGDKDAQKWDGQILLKYSRTEYRLLIDIPRKHERNIISADEFIKEFPIQARGFVLEFPGHKSWYIYRGRILPQWIKEVKKIEQEK